MSRIVPLVRLSLPAVLLAAAVVPASARAVRAAAGAAGGAVERTLEGVRTLHLPCTPRRGTHISISDGRGRRTLLIADSEHCLEVRTDGAVEFTDDDGDVRRLSPGGSLDVEEVRGGVTRHMAFVERDGRVERRYRENGVERPAGDAAEWLRTVLPQVARESAAGAEARAARVLRARGVAGVLGEVRAIASDGIKRIYVTTLLEQRALAPAELREVARVAGRAFASDGDKGAVLQLVVGRGGGDAGVLAAVTEAASTIASDSEKGRVIAAVLAAPGAGAEARAAAARAARDIASDRTKADVLVALAPHVDAGGAPRAAYLDAARTIASDAERRRVLLALLDARADAVPDARDDALFGVVDGIASDRERGAVLRAVLRREALSRDAVLAVLRSAEGIASDREKAEVLLALAARRGALTDDAVRRAFFAATKGIASSSEYRRVMEAVVR